MEIEFEKIRGTTFGTHGSILARFHMKSDNLLGMKDELDLLSSTA